MGRKKFIKKLQLSLAAILAINTSAVISVKATENIAKDLISNNANENLNIMPMPKDMVLGEGLVDLNDSVNIIGANEADIHAINLLKEILNNLGITVNETVVEGATTIYIGEKDDNVSGMDELLTNMNIDLEAITKAEGYILATEDNEAGDNIVIRGNDEVGTFYGVQSLKQIIDKKDNVKTVTNSL